MIKQKVQIVLFSSDREFVDRLSMLLLGQDEVIAYLGTGPKATADCALDALFLYGMQGSYLGVRSPAPGEPAEVFATPIEKQGLGLPGRLVAGSLTPAEAADDAEFARLGYRLVLNAVERSDCACSVPIMRIGSVPENLGIKKQSPERAVRSLLEAVEDATSLRYEHHPQSLFA